MAVLVQSRVVDLNPFHKGTPTGKSCSGIGLFLRCLTLQICYPGFYSHGTSISSLAERILRSAVVYLLGSSWYSVKEAEIIGNRSKSTSYRRITLRPHRSGRDKSLV